MASMPASLPSRESEEAPVTGVAADRLADCVRRLDPGTRALLDLSVRRRLRDDAMAPLLRIDPFHLAWRRARALERVASEMGGDEPLPLASVRAALEVLPREAWDPLARPALPAPSEPEAEKAEETVIPEAAEPETAAPETETGTDLVPTATAEVDAPQSMGLIRRLDAFAIEAPTLRRAFGDVGRAFARKAVRMVVWRRRRA
jgi:hypothetical protein